MWTLRLWERVAVRILIGSSCRASFGSWIRSTASRIRCRSVRRVSR